MKIKITGLRVLGMLTLLVVTFEIECNYNNKYNDGSEYPSRSSP